MRKVGNRWVLAQQVKTQYEIGCGWYLAFILAKLLYLAAVAGVVVGAGILMWRWLG